MTAHGQGGAPGHGRPGVHGGALGRRSHGLLELVFYAGRRRRTADRLVETSGAAPGDRVVDVGCGHGYLAGRLARRVAPGGMVVGLDADPLVIDAARQRSRANCRYEVGNAASLDVRDGSVDVVVSSLVLHHLPEDDAERAVGEMLRILRPGGSVLIAEFRPPRSRLLRGLVGRHSPAMAGNPVGLVLDRLRGAGFERGESGDVRPWIHWVRAVKPVPGNTWQPDAGMA